MIHTGGKMFHNWQRIKSSKWFEDEENWILPYEKKQLLKAVGHHSNIKRLMYWARYQITRIRTHVSNRHRAAAYITNEDSTPQIIVSLKIVVKHMGNILLHPPGLPLSNPSSLDPYVVVTWAHEQMENISCHWYLHYEFNPQGLTVGQEDIREMVEAFIQLLKHLRIWAVPFTDEDGCLF
jgi:phosphotransferase system IIB component